MFKLIGLISFLFVVQCHAQVLTLTDDFESKRNVPNWIGDNCIIDTCVSNPLLKLPNNSTKVLRYTDIGGQYANLRINTGFNFNLETSSVFSFKLYVPSSSITGSQSNQVSLKLQNGNLGAPWSNQCEIIKPILLDEWQILQFDFSKDTFINLDPNSPHPLKRLDFNRIVIQVNGENNNALVTAYLDDFNYQGNQSVYSALVWSDEFNGNGMIDTAKWYHQVKLPNGNSWFNGELQHYTNRLTNSSQSGGVLTLTAKKESFADQSITKSYTSARLNSKFAFKYGRVEVRAKLPKGKGTWPAIWTLGKSIIEPGAYWSNRFGTLNWPACGEIDIMEHWGTNQDYVQSAIHTPSSFGNTVNLGGQLVSNVSDSFHVYTLEWSETKLLFKVDNTTHYEYNPTVKDANTWPFNSEQYLLLNIAIEPSIESSFNQSSMVVDYVRVYQKPSSNIVLETYEPAVLYPNPVQSVLNLQHNQTVSALRILSVLGQEMMAINDVPSEMSIDVSVLPPGIYMIEFNRGNALSYQSFIKH
jgi:beta-glucanase (GH16 family)